jgi:hypothetical protein
MVKLALHKNHSFSIFFFSHGFPVKSFAATADDYFVLFKFVSSIKNTKEHYGQTQIFIKGFCHLIFQLIPSFPFSFMVSIGKLKL